MKKTRWSDKEGEKGAKKDYLILRIFQSNDWEGAYHETVASGISSAPKSLDKELRKLPMAKGGYFDKRHYRGKVYKYICCEVLAIDGRLKVAKRFKPDVQKYRWERRRRAKWVSMWVRK